MKKDEFTTAYLDLINTAISFSEKARREGLLALEDSIDHQKEDERDIFHYGLRFVVDGTDSTIIDKILSNIISQEKNEYLRMLKNVQKEAVMCIQNGFNPRIMYYLLNSYTDRSIKDDGIFSSEQPEPDTDGQYDAWS
jgi:flagellar motor component MotA